MSSKEHSKIALKWLLTNLLQDGDELICLMLYLEGDAATTLSYQATAKQLLDTVVSMADPELQINIIVELGIGKIKTIVTKTLVLYQPSLVIVGSTSGDKSAFSANWKRMRHNRSLSSYLISKSPVPVIIVTSSRRRLLTDETQAYTVEDQTELKNPYFADLVSECISLAPVKSEDPNLLRPTLTDHTGTSGWSDIPTEDEGNLADIEVDPIQVETDHVYRKDSVDSMSSSVISPLDKRRFGFSKEETAPPRRRSSLSKWKNFLKLK